MHGTNKTLPQLCLWRSPFDSQPGGQTSAETDMKHNYSSNNSEELPLSLPISQNDLIKGGQNSQESVI